MTELNRSLGAKYVRKNLSKRSVKYYHSRLRTKDIEAENHFSPHFSSVSGKERFFNVPPNIVMNKPWPTV